jgi:hypothetical protein
MRMLQESRHMMASLQYSGIMIHFGKILSNNIFLGWAEVFMLWFLSHSSLKVNKLIYSFEPLLGSTVNSRFKKVHFSFLISRYVWFKKDLCSESKNWSPEKNALCRLILQLEIFLKSRVYCTQKSLIEFWMKKILSKRINVPFVSR